ncbi:MAG: hypothetical protein JXB03_07370 [Spirochaetales bacterium]|nr:hypothetical protein [Spirochaetales bacterium]
MKKILLLSWFVTAFFGLWGEDRTEVLDPEGWYVIQTPGFEIIFPGAIEKDARYAADLLEATVDAVYSRVNGEKIRRRRWSIVLSNTSFIPNGYVTVAPRKSHWYELPAYDFIGGTEWYAMLASHETRHMAQFDHLSAGFVSVLRFFLGDYGEAVGINGALPRWYFEGDAVLTETLLSREGRGRSGEFANSTAALLLGDYSLYRPGETLLARDRPTLPQMVHRSYHRYIPSHYELGYHLVDHVRRHYGEDAWNRISAGATKLPVPALGLTVAVRKETGKSVSELYADMEQEFAAIWDNRLESFAPGTEPFRFPDWRPVIPPGASWTRYGSKGMSPDGRFLYLTRYDLDTGTRIVQADTATGDLHELYVNIAAASPVSFGGTRAAWITRVQDPIVPDTAYGEITVSQPGMTRAGVISNRGRYYRVALSPDGNTLAALSYSFEREASVHLYQYSDGAWQISGVEPLPGGVQGADISAAPDGRFLVTVQEPGGMGVREWTPRGGSGTPGWKALVRNIPGQLGQAVEAGGAVYISGDMKGIAGIWKIEDGSLFLVTPGAYGARLPLVHDGRMYFSNYVSPEGESLDVIDLSVVRAVPFDAVPDFSEAFFYQENSDTPGVEPVFVPEKLVSIERKNREVKPYPLVRRIPHYHSRIPMFDLSTESVSLSLVSDDILGTTSMTTMGFYSFDTGEWLATHHIELLKTFPRIIVGAGVGGEKDAAPQPSGYVRLGFPVTMNNGKWQTGMNGLVGIQATHEDQRERIEFPVSYSARYSTALYEGYRSYQPYLGFTASAGFSHLPLGSVHDYRASGTAAVYLPGGIRHGGFALTAAAAHATGMFNTEVFFLPGYAPTAAPFVSTLSAAWDIPIAYPDFNFLHLTFTKRRRLGMYADAGWISAAPSANVYSRSPDLSVRVGLIDDATVLNLEFLELSVSYGAGYTFGDYGAFDAGRLFPWLRLTGSIVN